MTTINSHFNSREFLSVVFWSVVRVFKHIPTSTLFALGKRRRMLACIFSYQYDVVKIDLSVAFRKESDIFYLPMAL
jgi:hypothetical protein